MPRSPSRDLSDRFTGRRGYFHQPDSIRRGKYLLSAVALIAGGAWAALDVAQPARTAYAHTHGPLANPHAAFDDNCAACHATHGISEFSPASVFKTRDRWHDLTCEKCHAGPTHHASATEEGKAFHNRCSNCHHDHNGRNASLVRISDNHCTKCHSNLSTWHDGSRVGSKPDYAETVTHFVDAHPDFRSLNFSPNSRTLKFSHAVHMDPGQTLKMTVGQLRERFGPLAADRFRKPDQTDASLVTLDCASCHRLDSGIGSPEFGILEDALDAAGEPTRSLLPPRGDGKHFQPVNFEVHCRVCHPLNAPAGSSAGKVVPGFAVPHRRQPADLLTELKAGYVKNLITSGHPDLARPPQPGGKIDPQPPMVPGVKSLGQEADELAATARGVLLSGSAGCYKCHDGNATKPSIDPVPDRTVWLQHAKFSHSAHRGASCATCHPGTYTAFSPGTPIVEKEPVQILGIESCKACHSPAGTKVTLPDGTKTRGGGIRHNCTDCHRYHNNDHPLQGRGAPAWLPNDPHDLGSWLKGK